MIAVVGGYGVGMTMVVPRAPEAGETVSGGVLSTGHGGKGSNQAVAISRLGVQASLLTAIGRDAAGDTALAFWEAEGVAADAVLRLDEATMAGFILVEPSGENRIALADGALAAVPADAAEGFADHIRSARLLVISLEVPEPLALAAAQLARAAGVPVLLNPAPATANRQLIGLADVLTPNQPELAQIVGAPEASVEECLGLLRDWYSGSVVVTCGADGAIVDENGDRAYVEPVPPERVVDTTGAGDAFTAALAVALSEGNDLLYAARFAAAAGACAVSVAEVIPALPTRESVDRRLAFPTKEETLS